MKYFLSFLPVTSDRSNLTKATMPDYQKHKNFPSNDAFQRSSFRYFKYYLIILFTVMLIFGYLEYRSFSTEDFSVVHAKETVIHLRNLIDDEKSLLQSDGNKVFFIESHLEGERNLEKPRQACRFVTN